MSDLPDINRFKELRPDLTFMGSMNATAVYVMAMREVHDGHVAPTEEAFLAWVNDQYPDTRAKRRRGRPRSGRAKAWARFEEAVLALRADGLPSETDEDVASYLGVEPRQIRRWRERFDIPYANEIEDRE